MDIPGTVCGLLEDRELFEEVAAGVEGLRNRNYNLGKIINGRYNLREIIDILQCNVTSLRCVVCSGHR